MISQREKIAKRGDSMEVIYDVNTGEVKIASKKGILRASALGSCVAIVAFDPEKKIGGLAHIMIPGKCQTKDCEDETRYSEDGIDMMLSGMIQEGSNENRIQTCIVGGGNVLRRAEDTIAEDNIAYVINDLTQRKLPIMARSVGGFERRSVLFSIDQSTVFVSIGDGSLHHLHNFDSLGSQGGN
jgi:chemotaxis protein CheD